MPEAARLSDPVLHGSTFGAMIVGAALGALAGAALVMSGGTALAIAGAALSGMSLGSAIGDLAAALFPKTRAGEITLGSPTVFINDRPAARAILDVAACSSVMALCFTTHPIAEGSSTVFIDRAPAARKGDVGQCSFVIGGGSTDVIIGGDRVRCMKVGAEVPGWFQWTMIVSGVVGPGMYLRALSMGWGPLAARLGGALAGGIAFGLMGDYAGAELFGEGTFLHKLTSFTASLLGAMFGGWVGAKVKLRYPASSAASDEHATTILSALKESGFSVKDHTALGVVVHGNKSVTFALSGRPVRLTTGQGSNGTKMNDVLTKLNSGRVKYKFIEELPEEMFNAGVRPCAEAKLFSQLHASPARSMSVRHIGKQQNKYRSPRGDRNMEPCGACAEQLARSTNAQILKLQGLDRAATGAAAGEGIEEVLPPNEAHNDGAGR